MFISSLTIRKEKNEMINGLLEKIIELENTLEQQAIDKLIIINLYWFR